MNAVLAQRVAVGVAEQFFRRLSVSRQAAAVALSAGPAPMLWRAWAVAVQCGVKRASVVRQLISHRQVGGVRTKAGGGSVINRSKVATAGNCVGWGNKGRGGVGVGVG